MKIRRFAYNQPTRNNFSFSSIYSVVEILKTYKTIRLHPRISELSKRPIISKLKSA